jgi:hypothetical protein
MGLTLAPAVPFEGTGNAHLITPGLPLDRLADGMLQDLRDGDFAVFEREWRSVVALVWSPLRIVEPVSDDVFPRVRYASHLLLGFRRAPKPRIIDPLGFPGVVCRDRLCP